LSRKGIRENSHGRGDYSKEKKRKKLLPAEATIHKKQRLTKCGTARTIINTDLHTE